MGEVLAGNKVLKIGSKLTGELIKVNVQKLATSIFPILGGGFANWAADQLKTQYGAEILEYTYTSAQFISKNGKQN